MTTPSAENRPHDIVLFGATGFAGRHAAARLGEAAPEGLRWAVAGRSPEPLGQLAEELGCGVVIADVEDAASMRAMAQSTRVVLSTAGPFARLGPPVVEACVGARTHYADITGEVTFMRPMIDRFHGRAQAEGTAILPASGFDSVPAEVATLMAMEEARRRGAQLQRLQTVYRLRGGLNGGTLASAILILREGDRRLLADPFSLVPDAEPGPGERRELGDPTRPTFDPTGQRYVAPFFMAAINRRVVRRMIELARGGTSPGVPTELAEALAEGFRYDEYQSVSKGRGRMAAWLTTGMLGAGAAFVSTRPGAALARRFGPKPGEGPSDEVLKGGITRSTSTAFLGNGERFTVQQDMDGDPGNAATCRILVEVGLALAAGEALGGGVITPVTALGQGLVKRLQAPGGRGISIG